MAFCYQLSQLTVWEDQFNHNGVDSISLLEAVADMIEVRKLVSSDST